MFYCRNYRRQSAACLWDYRPCDNLTASIMHALNADISSVILVIFMAGVFQVILAMTSLPSIVKYVPYPVISGFMNGIGVIIL